MFHLVESHVFQYESFHRRHSHGVACHYHAICAARRLQDTMEDRERIL